MKRLLVVLAVLSITAAACSSSDGVVASVNDEDIERSQVDVLAPGPADELEASVFARYLSIAIQWKAVVQGAAAEYGIEPTDDEIDAKFNEFVEAQGQAAFEALSEEGVRGLAAQLVIQEAVESELAPGVDSVSDDVVSGEIIENFLDWTIVCSAHILVETENEAVAVIARLDAGEDFGDVARDVSTDTGSGANGGDLGCSSPSGYVTEFAAATMAADLNVVTDPIESEFGYHVILVSGREEATPEVVRETLERNALIGAVDAWFVRVVGDAVVVIDEGIGVWVTEPSPQVVTVN
jgi:parvulin-like peptidyl-prolyl isomerase